jgi:UDP-N-acetylenolpyruvoylglucosamine reductase
MKTLKQLAGDRFLEHLPLNRLCSYRIGGEARFYLEVSSEEEIHLAFEFAKKFALPILLLGNGSNILFDDDGFEGLVLRISSQFEDFYCSDDVLVSPAGKNLSTLVRFSQKNYAHHLDFLGKIPGNVGGSLANNAGAFGRDMSSAVLWVEGFTLKGKFQRLQKNEINFSYRYCGLRGQFIILRVGFSRADRALKSVGLQDFNQYRKKTQPLRYPSAGCIFKNPALGSAGQLIDSSGCKLMRCGAAEVSDLHANFIINRGEATAASIRELVSRVRDRVYQTHGIRLERELQYAHEAILKVA